MLALIIKLHNKETYDRQVHHSLKKTLNMLEKFQAGKLSLNPETPELDVQVYKGGVMKYD